LRTNGPLNLSRSRRRLRLRCANSISISMYGILLSSRRTVFQQGLRRGVAALSHVATIILQAGPATDHVRPFGLAGNILTGGAYAARGPFQPPQFSRIIVLPKKRNGLPPASSALRFSAISMVRASIASPVAAAPSAGPISSIAACASARVIPSSVSSLIFLCA